MAGTLEISDCPCWTPAGWVYDNALERIASFLSRDDSTLADSLLSSRTDENGGYCDIREYDEDRLLKLIQAADAAFMNAESEGAESFYDPSSHQGFMDRFQELREMLRARQRELTQPG